MDTLAIIKRIEILLTEKNMSKADFYEKSGISSASFSQWKTGKFTPSRKKVQSAADVLGVSAEYLLTGEETKKAPADNGERDVLDEIDVAFYGEYKELDEDQKATIRDMVAVMRKRKNAGRKRE